MLYSTSGGLAAVLVPGQRKLLESDIPGISKPHLQKGDEYHCSQVTSQLSLTEGCFPPILAANVRSQCRSVSRKTVAPKWDNLPGLFLACALFPGHVTAGPDGILPPCTIEICQTPKKWMCLNLPEPVSSKTRCKGVTFQEWVVNRWQLHFGMYRKG